MDERGGGREREGPVIQYEKSSKFDKEVISNQSTEITVTFQTYPTIIAFNKIDKHNLCLLQFN